MNIWGIELIGFWLKSLLTEGYLNCALEGSIRFNQ
jgi:hypothetical protein